MCSATQSPPRPEGVRPPAEAGVPGREPAPGVLRLVQEFLNTHDIEAEVDQLGSPQAAMGWFSRHKLIETEGSIGRAEWSRAREAREALRLLLMVNDRRGPVDPGVLQRLNQVAARSRFALRFVGDGQAQLEPTSKGVDAAVGWVLAAALTAMSEGTWSRLKICHRESCRWAFYDHSRNQSGKWCSMEICGNRTKVEAYRRRRSRASRGFRAEEAWP
ncbi:MAG: CGNR zinc finger domain-containing protein [Actinomycetota bacterium]